MFLFDGQNLGNRSVGVRGGVGWAGDGVGVEGGGGGDGKRISMCPFCSFLLFLLLLR